jgi:hypothetical protein
MGKQLVSKHVSNYIDVGLTRDSFPIFRYYGRTDVENFEYFMGNAMGSIIGEIKKEHSGLEHWEASIHVNSIYENVLE